MGLIADPISAGIGLVETFINKFIPDKDLANKLVAAANSEQFAGDLQLTMGQISINLEEAKSASLFVSGWRPAVGWVCVAALAYNYIIYRFLNYGLTVWVLNHPGLQMPPLPQLDSGELFTLLSGLLGLGTLRTIEKVKEVSRSSMK